MGTSPNRRGIMLACFGKGPSSSVGNCAGFWSKKLLTPLKATMRDGSYGVIPTHSPLRARKQGRVDVGVSLFRGPHPPEKDLCGKWGTQKKRHTVLTHLSEPSTRPAVLLPRHLRVVEDAVHAHHGPTTSLRILGPLKGQQHYPQNSPTAIPENWHFNGPRCLDLIKTRLFGGKLDCGT